MRKNSFKTALGGLLSALALCFLFLGGVLPFANLLGPVCAAVCVLFFHAEFGTKPAAAMYGCVSLLCLLLASDMESALLFAGFLGWYPLFRAWLHARLGGKKVLLWAVKFAVFGGCIAALYTLMLRVLAMPALREEFAGYSRGMLVAILVLAALCFAVCDRAFGILRQNYIKVWRYKLLGKN
ncbi:MAG: hypothetical protein IKV55_01680 [Oscillospiraceae bacterium]|nr:hypothetical protein [Oscillospiraceae bacterium]